MRVYMASWLVSFSVDDRHSENRLPPYRTGARYIKTIFTVQFKMAFFTRKSPYALHPVSLRFPPTVAFETVLVCFTVLLSGYETGLSGFVRLRDLSTLMCSCVPNSLFVRQTAGWEIGPEAIKHQDS